jgi:hypothetical protein
LAGGSITRGPAVVFLDAFLIFDRRIGEDGIVCV